MSRFKLTTDEAVSILADGDEVHVFSNPGAGMLLGADWSRADVLREIAENKPELTGPTMAEMGHGLCINLKRRLFAATDPAKLAALEAALAGEGVNS